MGTVKINFRNFWKKGEKVDVGSYLGIFERIAEKKGWRTNPDKELLQEFAEGLLHNKERYGIAICPCRIATGDREIDRQIICPCVYAEEDIEEYGRCYCGLYVSKEYIEDKIPDRPIPDRHFENYFK